MKLLRNLADRLSRRKDRGENPSIRDFKDAKQLKSAFQKDTGSESRRDMTAKLLTMEGSNEDHSDSKSCVSTDSARTIEWKLPLVDESNTEPQTMEQEVERLKVLQSYFVLDSAAEEEFDRITRLASKVFDAPIALVSLVDLGRQWFLSKVGLDATETPRKHAFCAHVILNKYKILVILDATQDFRFKDNPLVTGGPRIRFYAGAALVSPEGYKLGTLCVISPNPRPQSLNQAEQEMLHEMAGIVVNTMVARRTRLINAQCDIKLQELGASLVETSKSIKASTEVVSSLMSRPAIKEAAVVSEGESMEMTMAFSELEMQAKLCAAVARSLLDKDETPTAGNEVAAPQGEDQAFNLDDFAKRLESILDPSTDMEKLFGNLCTVIKGLRHGATITMALDGNVPRSVAGDDLLLYRSALNLLLHGLSRSSSGSVHLRIFMKDEYYLAFECEDSGPIIPKQQIKATIHHEDSLLGPVATMVRSMNGSYGMRVGHLHSCQDDPRAIFWFRVPAVPSDAMPFSGGDDDYAKVHDRREVFATNSIPTTTTPSKGLPVLSDPFKAVLIESGCLTQYSYVQ